MDSARGNRALPLLGFPIRTSPDQCLVGNSPRLFAATHVLHRLQQPRHPSHALSSLVDPNLALPQTEFRTLKVKIQTRFGRNLEPLVGHYKQ